MKCLVLPVSPRARGSFVSLAKFKEPPKRKVLTRALEFEIAIFEISARLATNLVEKM
jgi:hypothetical protein